MYTEADLQKVADEAGKVTERYKQRNEQLENALNRIVDICRRQHVRSLTVRLIFDYAMRGLGQKEEEASDLQRG